MSNPELPWKLLPKEDGLWLHITEYYGTYQGSRLINLGPKDKVMEAMQRFLEQQRNRVHDEIVGDMIREGSTVIRSDSQLTRDP